MQTESSLGADRTLPQLPGHSLSLKEVKAGTQAEACGKKGGGTLFAGSHTDPYLAS